MTLKMTLEHNGVAYQGEIWRIEKTELGTEDHGIFTATLRLARQSSGWMAGGYALDAYDAALKRRVGTAFGLDHIKAIMHAVGASTWESLAGRDVILLTEEGRVMGIANVRDESRILVFAEHCAEWDARQAVSA